MNQLVSECKKSNDENSSGSVKYKKTSTGSETDRIPPTNTQKEAQEKGVINLQDRLSDVLPCLCRKDQKVLKDVLLEVQADTDAMEEFCSDN